MSPVSLAAGPPEPATGPPSRWRRHGRVAALAGASAAVVVALFVAVIPPAAAATLLSDDFQDGSADGWSKSGGSWSVVTDGSLAYNQSNVGSELARAFAGSTSWANYSLQARVRPTGFDGSARYVGIAARTSSSTTFYRLALLNSNRAELQAVNSGSVTVIGGVTQTVSTGTWYALRIDVSGSTIRGLVNGTQIASGTDTSISAGRVSLQTFHATASFDDVVVSDSATTPTSGPPSASPTTTTPTTSPTASVPPTTTTGLVGWATQGGGTTGGAGGSTVTVSSLADLTTAVSATGAAIIRVNGNFGCSDDVRVAGGNKTILGVGANSGLTGCGINIRDISNVIVRNLKISKVPAGNGNGDAIHIDHATRLWLDHNDLSSDTTHGTDFYDGLLDITHGSDFITVSWNNIHDHVKCSLVGHSDSNTSEDTGHLRVTYHHNNFTNCGQRNPRVRFGNPVHVYNNYYFQNTTFDYSYGIATTCNAGVLVESNYFENIADPTHIGEGSSPVGNLVARNNVLVNSGSVLTNGSVAAIPYAYTVDPAVNVKSIVTSGAGTGKIST